MNITHNTTSPYFGKLIIRPGALKNAENLDFKSVNEVRARMDVLEHIDLELTPSGPQIAGRKSDVKFVDKFELTSKTIPNNNRVEISTMILYNGKKFPADIILPYDSRDEAVKAYKTLHRKKGIERIMDIVEKLDSDQCRKERGARPFYIG